MAKQYVSILKINMVEQASLEFRLRTIETRNYLLNEIKHNDLLSKKCKETCKYLNYIKHLLILVSTVTGCVLISAFAPLFPISFGFTSSAVGIEIYAIAAGIKKYLSIIQKKKKKTW